VGRRAGAWASLLLLLGWTLLPGEVSANLRPRALLILPFQPVAVDPAGEWMGEGVAQSLALAFAQYPGFIQVDRNRLRRLGYPEVCRHGDWQEVAVPLPVLDVLLTELPQEVGDRPGLPVLWCGRAEPTMPTRRGTVLTGRVVKGRLQGWCDHACIPETALRAHVARMNAVLRRLGEPEIPLDSTNLARR